MMLGNCLLARLLCIAWRGYRHQNITDNDLVRLAYPDLKADPDLKGHIAHGERT